jgi:hypothetical protein
MGSWLDSINATRFKLRNIIEATENLRDTCNYTVTVSDSESVLNEITLELVLSLIMWYGVLTLFNRMCPFRQKKIKLIYVGL